MRPIALSLLFSAGLFIAAACEPSADDEVEVIDLGSVSLSDTGGYSGALAVEMPPLTTSAIPFCGGYGDNALGAVWTLTDPSGSVVYNGEDADTSRWRSEFLDDMAPALLPVSPKLPMAEGTWSFDWFIGAGNGGSIDCKAVIRSGMGDEVGSEATINVEIVFVGVDLDASSAPDDPDWQAVMDRFESEWGTAGITVNPLYKDFSGDLARFTVVDITDDDYAEFNDLLRTANPDDPRSMTFFVVEEVANNSAGGSTILGLSSGPPGAATVQRTSKSGVIVSGIDFRGAPDDVGKIMAHEGGHFLGLFHTTERDGGQSDPLDDTPVGEASDNNVMWWTLTQGNATLSADQGWVVRRNPVSF